jgi:peptide/nickel transport system substrate-binding protein
MRRLWLSTVMLVAGAALIAAAQLAGAAPDRGGGVFKFGTTGASVQVDPQLAFITTSWWMQYATAAKLYNYAPTGKLRPEVASRYKISNGGRRYTFFIRKGFRFSDGTPVTSRSFKYAINRVANKDLASPGAQFITDRNAVAIVGARDVNNGRATNVRGVQARGNRLIIDLVRANPRLLTIIAMPFFQATSAKLPLDRVVVNVSSKNDLPSAGPYAFTHNDVNTKTSLRRNPFWKRGGPGRNAPRNLAGVDVLWNLNEQVAFEMVERSELDEGPLPAADVERVASHYGINKARFWVKTGSCLGVVAFNNSRGLFQGNVQMRKAVNWALDRTDYGAVVTGGSFLRTPWTHLLPPGYPGSITKKSLQPYPPRANIAKARELAAGHFKDGTITVYYRSSGTINPAQAEVVKRDLINLGFAPANITMKGFTGGDIYTAVGVRGGDWDLAVSLGMCSDFPVPSDFFSLGFAFGGSSLFDNSEYRARLAAALRLRGAARDKALGKLDVWLMKNLAPLAVMHTYNNRYFFSARVDPSSLKYHTVYEDWSIPALALK